MDNLTREWKREDRLTRVVHAAGYPNATVEIVAREPGEQPEGEHYLTSMGSTLTICVRVASYLSDPWAEATALHEIAHVEFDHDDDPDYREAIAKDAAAGIDHHRGPWEIEADAFAAAIVDASEMTDATDSLACLFDDAARYP